MYSALKNIQILVSLLKAKGISNIVLSPGGSSIPLIRSIEDDDYFCCHSVVDEGSAAFYAIGIAQAVNKPVAVVCTSGTAASNYAAGVTEAYYRNVPLVIITADRNIYMLNQLQTQKIDQMTIFRDICRKSVNLPHVRNEIEFNFCERLINEALLELDHHGQGPVHINIPTMNGQSRNIVKTLPRVRNIRRISYTDAFSVWEGVYSELRGYKRILVICGQSNGYTDDEIETMRWFEQNYPCVFCGDYLANLPLDHLINNYPITESMNLDDFNKVLPDLVITFGHNLAGETIKFHLQNHSGEIPHWSIVGNGKIIDAFRSLEIVFECTPEQFFSKVRSYGLGEPANRSYYQVWKGLADKIHFDRVPYSNFLVAQKLTEIVPENAQVHLAILNSTRHPQYFRFRKGVKVYSNIGALGIDGCLSTFLGQAITTDELSFLLIGDLSFLYDLSATTIDYIRSNVRIILVNNGGGGEFHIILTKEQAPDIDKHIAAGHNISVRDWIQSIGFEYYSAKDEKSLDEGMHKLLEKTGKPAVLEVFTDVQEDGRVTRELKARFKSYDSRRKWKDGIKGLAVHVIGANNTQKALSLLKKRRARKVTNEYRARN